MAWIKMGDAAAAVSCIFGVFFLTIVYKYQRMKWMFMIPRDMMVRGDVRVNCGSTEVACCKLLAYELLLASCSDRACRWMWQRSRRGSDLRPLK